MITTVISMLVIGYTCGFLLENRNTSSLAVRPSYLSKTEYYRDKNKINHDLEAYRDQNEKSLNLLTDQLQQKFDIIEQILAAQPSHNEFNETKQTIGALEQKYHELELKYNAVQAKLTVKEHMYNSVVNKTLDLEGKIRELEQLKNINQLQTLQTLQAQVQTFDSRINLLNGHEQARNQDFLALYNLTKSSRHEIENQMNNKFKTIEEMQNKSTSMLKHKQQQNFRLLNNLTLQTGNEIEKLANHTKDEIEQLGRFHNSSLSIFQQFLDTQLKKVMVTGCTNVSIFTTQPAGLLKFPDIKTSIGVPNLSSFQSTGKFTCQVPGYYYIVTTMKSPNTIARIDLMKNSTTIHWQFVKDSTNDAGYSIPDTAVVALELKPNDNVCIKLQTPINIYQSCITIFKIV